MDPNNGDHGADEPTWEIVRIKNKSEIMVPMCDKNLGPTWDIVAEQGRRMIKRGEDLLKVARKRSDEERCTKCFAFFRWKGLIYKNGAYTMDKRGYMVRNKRKNDTWQ